MTDWAARVLDEVDAAAAGAEARLAALVRVPSVGGTDAEARDPGRCSPRDLRGPRPRGRPLAAAARRAAGRAGLPRRRGASAREAWGLVGRLPGRGDGPSLMLDGHVDVVPTGDLATRGAGPDPFSGAVVAGELHGRGACDMKAGLVAAMTAVEAVRRAGAPLRGDVLLACVPGEEDGGLGTYATLRRGWRADACVLPEPTGLDVVPANGGALTFRLRVPGVATHASRRTEGVSAITKALPVLAALERLEARRNADVDPVMARWPVAYPLSVGRIEAGDWASTVPDLLVAEGRLGVALDEPVEDARRRARGRGGRGVRGRPVAGGAPGARRVVGRAVRVRAAAGRQRPGRAGRPRPTPGPAVAPRRAGARRTAATSGCSPAPASPRCTTGRATRASRTPRTSGCRSPRCTPPPARWRCSPSTSAASPSLSLPLWTPTHRRDGVSGAAASTKRRPAGLWTGRAATGAGSATLRRWRRDGRGGRCGGRDLAAPADDQPRAAPGLARRQHAAARHRPRPGGRHRRPRPALRAARRARGRHPRPGRPAGGRGPARACRPRRADHLLGLLERSGVLHDGAADHRALARLSQAERDRLQPDVAAASATRAGSRRRAPACSADAGTGRSWCTEPAGWAPRWSGCWPRPGSARSASPTPVLVRTGRPRPGRPGSRRGRRPPRRGGLRGRPGRSRRRAGPGRPSRSTGPTSSCSHPTPPGRSGAWSTS